MDIENERETILNQDKCNYKGKINLILGPMFSGKTTELIRRIERYKFANRSCICLKYANDLRFSEKLIVTHNKYTLEAFQTNKLFDYAEFIRHYKYEVIGIDEGQFFPDCVSFCEQMANEGKIVIVAALNGSFERKNFGDILNLIPMSENLEYLKSICMICYKKASFTKRISDDVQLEIIGGSEKYKSLCRKCYFTFQKKLTFS